MFVAIANRAHVKRAQRVPKLDPGMTGGKGAGGQTGAMLVLPPK